MSQRDDFSEKVKAAVAARAGWRCSFPLCPKLLVGPSEESPTAVSKTGVVAHICGAAPGAGSRRYVAAMTPEERSSIDNAIWLCADHATLIDRDAVTYTAEGLRVMKREHEQEIARTHALGSSPDLGVDLLALGPDIVFSGDITQIAADAWTLRLAHFLAGDIHKLVSFIDGFAKTPPADRYVLSNGLGDGRVLSQAPSLTKHRDGYSLLCPVEASFPRIDVQKLGSSMAEHPDTGDLYLDNRGHIARVSGVDYLPQKVKSLLSMQKGESVFSPRSGMRFFEYFDVYKGSPWLSSLMKLDVIRQASIPFSDILIRSPYTPLQCVTRVHDVELLAETPTNNRLPLRLDLDVKGLGRWQHQISIYMPSARQMAEREKLLEQHREAIQSADWSQS